MSLPSLTYRKTGSCLESVLCLSISFPFLPLSFLPSVPPSFHYCFLGRKLYFEQPFEETHIVRNWSFLRRDMRMSLEVDHLAAIKSWKAEAIANSLTAISWAMPGQSHSMKTILDSGPQKLWWISNVFWF